MIIARMISRFSLLSLFSICIAELGGPAAAQPPTYPLYCQGPLHTVNDATRFTWAGSAAGGKGPGAGQCAWADRAPQGSEFVSGHGNTICGTLGRLANLPFGEFMEIGVYLDAAHNNCMRVAQTPGLPLAREYRAP